jgi:hypothetical protein
MQDVRFLASCFGAVRFELPRAANVHPREPTMHFGNGSWK